MLSTRPSLQNEVPVDDYHAELMVSPALQASWAEFFAHIQKNDIGATSTGSCFLTDVQQGYITPEMRYEVCMFIMDVASYDNLTPAIAERSIRVFDQCLRTERLRRSSLQLVALASILVAAKMDDVTPPSLSALAYYADGQYSIEDITVAERHVLSTIGWHANLPTAHVVASTLIAALGVSSSDVAAVYSHASGLITSSIAQYSMARLPLSVLAVATVHASCFALDVSHSKSLADLAEHGVDMDAVDDCVHQLIMNSCVGHSRKGVPPTPVDLKRAYSLS